MEMEEFNKKKNDLEIQKAEAEAIMDGAEVGRLEQELAQLEANKHTYETLDEEVKQDATESQIKQITDLGGSEEELNKRLEGNKEEVKKIEEVEEKTLDGDIEHKVNEELETASPTEEVVQNPSFKEQDAKKLEEFKDRVNQKMNAVLEEFKVSGDISLLKKFVKSLDGHLNWNLDTPEGHFLKEIDAKVEEIKNNAEIGKFTQEYRKIIELINAQENNRLSKDPAMLTTYDEKITMLENLDKENIAKALTSMNIPGSVDQNLNSLKSILESDRKQIAENIKNI